jgi:hypothetical protein
MNGVTASKKGTTFYKRVLGVLTKNKHPFMVGGAYALYEHSGVHRETKDLDIFCTKEDVATMLKSLADAGIHTWLESPDWIAKADEEDEFVDFIFADPQGYYTIDQEWIKRARTAKVLGYSVKIMPAEEMLVSKMYRQRRWKYEGPDVNHLILKKGKTLDWKRVLSMMGDHWQLIYAYIINFWFVYPSEKDCVPAWVAEEFQKRTKAFLKAPKEKKISRGVILSQKEYEIDVVEWGFEPAGKEQIVERK